MPKIRTRKGLSDRVRITRNGKLVRAHAWKSHLLEHKSARRKRAYRSAAGVSAADRKEARRMLGA
jgi:large subunit ribosomal protein L35